MKRLFDLAIAVPGYIIVSPLMMAIIIIVMMQDGGSPYFYQERCGIGNTKFKMIKFRTMKNGHHRIKDYPVDPRVTPFGKLLRKTHLDELPELFNVITGDMSLVGPRPMPYYVDEHTDNGIDTTDKIAGWNIRSTVKPGMTGMAQVYCPKMTSRRNKYRFDNLYIKRQSIWLDVKLILATFRMMVK